MEVCIVGLADCGRSPTVDNEYVAPCPTESLNVVCQTRRVGVEENDFPFPRLERARQSPFRDDKWPLWHLYAQK